MAMMAMVTMVMVMMVMMRRGERKAKGKRKRKRPKAEAFLFRNTEHNHVHVPSRLVGQYSGTDTQEHARNISCLQSLARRGPCCCIYPYGHVSDAAPWPRVMQVQKQGP